MVFREFLMDFCGNSTKFLGILMEFRRFISKFQEISSFQTCNACWGQAGGKSK